MMNLDFLGIFWGSSLGSAALGSAGLGVLILLCCSPVDPPACLGQWEIPGGVWIVDSQAGRIWPGGQVCSEEGPLSLRGSLSNTTVVMASILLLLVEVGAILPPCLLMSRTLLFITSLWPVFHFFF